MRRRRWVCRADNTQAAIVKALRKCGVAVELIGQPCDALVYWHGRVLLVDFKSPGGKPTEQQEAFGRRFPLLYWQSVEEALAALGVRTSAPQAQAFTGPH